MLKLREPIKLNLRSDFLSSKDDFTERIRGNYSYMGSELNEADLLHVTTQPPEVYLMGGGMTSMVNNANVENTQIQKVNVINNLINRILISADAKLSYQDSVYISNVLHKLGIKDDRTFMSEVYRLTRQTKQLNDVTDLYWENLEELREMISEYAGDMRLEFKSENEVINNSVLHLHEVVNRRLKTAAIYQIMRNYYENNEGDRSITNAEFKISEQGRFAKEVLLNRLRESVRFETQPLVYKHDNIYEGDETNVDNMSIEQLNERINSAVLLNLIDNIYELSYERTDHHVRNWVSTEDSYYGASDNVLYRLEQNTAYLQYLHEQYIKNIKDADEYTAEIEQVKQLLSIRQDIDRSLSISENRFSADNRSSESYYSDSAEMLYRTEGDHIEGDTYVINNEGAADVRLYNDQRTREGDTFVSSIQQINTQKTYETDNSLHIDQTAAQAPLAAPMELTHPDTQIHYEGDTSIDARSSVNRQGDVNLYDSSTHRSESTATINTQEVTGAVERILRSADIQPAELTYNVTQQGAEVNIDNRTQTDIREGDRLFETDINNSGANISVSRTDQHILQTQEGASAPQSVELTHITNEGDVTQNAGSTQNTQNFSESLYQTYQQNIARNRRYMQNLKNILENNAPQSTDLTPAQRTMQAAAMALENPERVIEQYTSAELHERERLENIRIESEKLLHPLQQRAHQLIREYLSAPERFYMSQRISRDNLGVLLHDIYHTAQATPQSREEIPSEATLTQPAAEAGGSTTASYPAASQRKGTAASYPDTSQREAETAGSGYETLTLQNIYPVYNIAEENTDISLSVENIAGSIRERAQAIREAAEESAGSKEVLEHILREENNSVREFTNVITNREISQGREVMVRHENETVSRLLENVVNRWAKRQIEHTAPVFSYEDEKVSFIHKSTENTVDEETIENIRQEMLKMEQTQRSLSEHTQNLIREEKTVVNNVNSRTIEENSEEIQRVVNRSVRSQIDAITEKVYGRIERQLKNEQRRRGL